MPTWAALRAGWRLRREAAALRRRSIPDDLWKRTLVRYPFLRRQDDPGAAELRRLTSLFLDAKEFTAAGGLRLTDAMVVAIAAQAVLPVLRLPAGLRAYDGFVGIVVHPGVVRVQREVEDADGVVHAYEEILSGEAAPGGPVMLSWTDVRAAGSAPGQSAYSVVIHEFAHVLDMAGGSADGQPPLPRELPAAEWQATLAAAFNVHCRRCLVADQPAAALNLPAPIIDAYGSTSMAEFFAVACEAFFVEPAAMKKEQVALYDMLVRYYGQDPAREQPAALGP